VRLIKALLIERSAEYTTSGAPPKGASAVVYSAASPFFRRT
jgi:hypothetical protein